MIPPDSPSLGLSHTVRHHILKEAAGALQPYPAWASVTFSISCLNVVNTSLLLERVFWNSSNFSVYRASWARKKPTVKTKLP